MKKLKAIFAISVFAIGLSLASCSKDEVIEPTPTPEQPYAPGAQHPVVPPPSVIPH